MANTMRAFLGKWKIYVPIGVVWFFIEFLKDSLFEIIRRYVEKVGILMFLIKYPSLIFGIAIIGLFLWVYVRGKLGLKHSTHSEANANHLLDKLNQLALTATTTGDEKTITYSEVLLRYATHLTDGVTSDWDFCSDYLGPRWVLRVGEMLKFLTNLCVEGIMERRVQNYEYQDERIFPNTMSIEDIKPHVVKGTTTKYFLTSLGLKLVTKLRERQEIENDTERPWRRSS